MIKKKKKAGWKVWSKKKRRKNNRKTPDVYGTKSQAAENVHKHLVPWDKEMQKLPVQSQLSGILILLWNISHLLGFI